MRAAVSLPPLGRTKNCGGHGLESFGKIGNGPQSGAFGAPFQLADIALGVAKGVSQLLLAPALVNPQTGEFGTECLGQRAGFAVLIGTNLFGHGAMVAN